jgi:crotonobetaine/carnitine-CoA ligase
MSIGTPLPWVGIELQGDEPDAGEIVMSSAIDGAVTAGYLDDAATTAATVRGGRLHTGDMARRDAQGRLQFIGRKSDSMRVRGENVSAWEVERAFASHPDVALTAAVGVPSVLGEQDILLYVKTRDDREADFAGLRDWGRRLLAPYQQPRWFRQVQSFVTTPSERIRKQFLSRDTAGCWDAAGGARD